VSSEFDKYQLNLEGEENRAENGRQQRAKCSEQKSRAKRAESRSIQYNVLAHQG
jgi:hypothetical protein